MQEWIGRDSLVKPSAQEYWLRIGESATDDHEWSWDAAGRPASYTVEYVTGLGRPGQAALGRNRLAHRHDEFQAASRGRGIDGFLLRENRWGQPAPGCQLRRE
ncbi:MAG: hypothetical protein QF749_02400 [Verrucomicrobiota bacterium]|nr:hypothetical protein [Verrucomicrobiota bacterium]MDP7177118.1 hypothetical protein [Verrucomicrobiota bacterium]MDP7292326.1 hypothetical protein [Verrucomicrobiota bacterium]MDP7441729.1 hypothetical protein [Verrucomicrobiota bacterium]